MPSLRPALVLLCAVVVATPGALQARQAPERGGTGAADPERSDATTFFHRGAGAGSDRMAGPFPVLLNKAFDVALDTRRSRDVFGYEYGWEHVGNSLRHPFTIVREDGGWGELLRTEILPINLFEWIGDGAPLGEVDRLKWYPNYAGHVIEGGITHRRMAEWFMAGGMARDPALVLSGVSLWGAALVNEAYDHPRLGADGRPGFAQEGSAASVIDLFVFEPLGIVLFSFDGVARFFAESLGAEVWPSQPVLTPAGEVLNAGNELVFRFDVLPGDDVELFLRAGLSSYLGTTVHRGDGWAWTVAAGFDTEELIGPQSTGTEPLRTSWAGAIYLDREGSLMARLSVGGAVRRAVALDVFPGVLADDLGGFVAVDGEGAVSFGLTTGWLGGLGVGSR